MIAIIDYGLGNVGSISKALEKMGHTCTITDDPEVVQKAEGLILPGIGTFSEAMYVLETKMLASTIKQEVLKGKPILGTGIGMQLLFTSGEENGYHQGLNILPGRVVRFKGDYPVPHMGWNWLMFKHPHFLFRSLKEDYVYFNHSYYVKADNDEDVIATTNYYQTVAAIVERNHVLGMQFQPEKSGSLGLKLLDRFVQMVKGKKVGK